MTEQITLNLPDTLAKQLREVAAFSQRKLEDVLLDWLDRGRTSSSPFPYAPSEADLLRQVSLGFSTDWWVTYRALIAERQAEVISDVNLARLVEMSEDLETANVVRVEALGKIAKIRGCTIEQVMESLEMI
jgi:hypothetical protein